MTRLLILAGAALMALGTLVYATHRRVPEYRMGDWDEADDGVQPWDAPQHPGFVQESPRDVEQVTLTLGLLPVAVCVGVRPEADEGVLDRHEEMCRAIRRTFEGLYDWRSDARVVAELLR